MLLQSDILYRSLQLFYNPNTSTLHFLNSALGIPLTENTNTKVNDKRMLCYFKFDQH